MTAPSNQDILREVEKLRKSTNRFQTELNERFAAIDAALDVIKEDTRVARKNIAATQDGITRLLEAMNVTLSFIENLPESKIELKIRK